MVECLWHSVPPRFLLQIVVANLLCCVQSLVNISVLKAPDHLVVVLCPYTSIEVSLQLKPDAQAVPLFLAYRCHLLVYTVEVAKEILYVMAYFMCYDVCVCEVSISTDILLHACEE